MAIAKENMKIERQNKTAALKEKWAQEKEERLADQQRKKAAELKATRDQLQAIAEKRKLNKEKERQKKAEAVLLRNEQLKAQNDERAQLARDLKEKKLKQRRESADLKLKIVREAQEKEKLLHQQQKDEERSLLESRRIGFLEARNAAKESERNRRQSLISRAQVSAKHREISKKMEKEKIEEEKGLLEFRKEAFIGKIEFEKEIQESRRRSLVGRLDKWRSEKRMEELAKKDELHQQNVEAEIKTQDWLDIQEYKKNIAQRERESLEKRIQKWREERTIEAEAMAKKAEEEQMERELFAQECEDVMIYQEQQEALRRQSLAYRLAVGRRDRDWEEGVEANAALIKIQERQILAEELEDVKNYKQELDENRRASLAFRLQQYVSSCIVFGVANI